MARKGWLIALAVLLVLAGGWYGAGHLASIDDPDLGPAVVVTPDPEPAEPEAPTTETPTTESPEPESPEPSPSEAVTVPPAAPRPAGECDPDDDPDDDDWCGPGYPRDDDDDDDD